MVAYPTATTPALASHWRLLAAGMGPSGAIVGDRTGDAFKVTVQGGNKVILVQPGGNAGIWIEGVRYDSEDTDPIPFDLGTLGTQPSAGQARRSLVVARRIGDTDIQIAVKTGAPAASGATDPSLVRGHTPGSTLEVPLWGVTQTGAANLTSSSLVDLRRWSGGAPLMISPTLTPASSDPSGLSSVLPDEALGTLAYWRDEIWVRRLYGTPSLPTWVCITDPPWTLLPLNDSAYSAGSQPPQYRRMGGGIQFRGRVVRTAAAFDPDLDTGNWFATLTAFKVNSEIVRCPIAMGEGDGGGNGWLSADPGDGTLRIRANSTGHRSAYLSGCWLPLYEN